MCYRMPGDLQQCLVHFHRLNNCLSHRGKNIICSTELKSSPPTCGSLLWELSSDSRLYYWVNNCGPCRTKLPGLICKFSIKVREQAGQQQSEWITKINSLPLMTSAQGMCTAETQWEGCSTRELAWEMRKKVR